MTPSGVSLRRSVSPGWPCCPPGFLPDDCRRLLVRGGFFSPSLDGGLPLCCCSARDDVQLGNARLLRQQQRDELVLRELTKGGVIHQLLEIGLPKSCQPKSSPARTTSQTIRADTRLQQKARERLVEGPGQLRFVQGGGRSGGGFSSGSLPGQWSDLLGVSGQEAGPRSQAKAPSPAKRRISALRVVDRDAGASAGEPTPKVVGR